MTKYVLNRVIEELQLFSFYHGHYILLLYIIIYMYIILNYIIYVYYHLSKIGL